jgi:hypothetical protein
MYMGVQTFVVIDPDLSISAEDFAAAWNARATTTGQTLAEVIPRQDTFDAELWTWLGHVADVVGIASFVGVPSIRDVIAWLVDSVGGPLASSGSRGGNLLETEAVTMQSESWEIEEIVEEDGRRTRRKIVVHRKVQSSTRHSANSNLSGAAPDGSDD